MKIRIPFLFTVIIFSLTCSKPAFSQLPVKDSLILWLDASAFATAGAVGQWNDLSGKNSHATQPTSQYQPVVVMNQVNALPVMHFDGTDDFFSAPADINPLVNPNITLFTVFRAKSFGTGIGGKLFSHDDGGYDRTIGFDGRCNAGTNFGAFSNAPDLVSIDNILMDSVYLLTSVYTPTSFSAWVNTINKLNGSFVANNDGLTDVNIGRNNSFVEFWDGDLAELVLYNRLLCDLERQQVEAYLSCKWGLSTGCVQLGIVNADTTLCNGGSVPLKVLGGTSWSWSPSAGLTSTTVNNPVATPGITTTYVVTVSDGLCTFKDSVTITIGNGTVADAGNDTTILIGNTANLLASGGGTYSWYPSSTLNCDTCKDPVATPDTTTTYYVVVKSANGCTSIDSVEVTVLFKAIEPVVPCKDIFVPNAFSPNEDDHNDVLMVRGDCFSSFSFRVYDRWGSMVFSSTVPEEGWNGTSREEKNNTGIFAFYLDAVLTDGTEVHRKGSINMIR